MPIRPVAVSCDSCFMEPRCWPECTPRSDAVAVEREPNLRAGVALWRHGAPFNGLYLVRSGCLKVIATDTTGDERVLHFAFAGDLLGLEALAAGRHDSSAIALAESMVCHLQWPPREEASTPPALLPMRLLQRASTLLRQRSRAVRLTDPDASVRVFLAEMAERIGREENRDGQRLIRVRLPMSRLEIGQYLGYAEETVCRSMRRLQRQGELEVSGRTLLVKSTG